MRVLVTGATGFLGAHVVRTLLKRDLTPIPTARKGSDLGRLAGTALSCLEMDVLSPASVRAAFETAAPDAVVHCAAYGVDFRQQDARTAILVNVAGTALVAEEAARMQVRRFIHVGTSYEYADKPSPLVETDPAAPMSLYGATKASGTLLALERSSRAGLPLAVVRPFGMFGPGEGDHKLIPLIMRACEKGEPLSLTGGEQIRDYLYVEDAAEAIVEMLLHPSFPSGEIFNLGSGVPQPLRDFILACARELGGESLMRLGELPYRPQEAWSVVADCAKWEGYYGKPISRTSREQGLKLTVSHRSEIARMKSR